MSQYDTVLNKVGFVPNDWRENAVDWWQLDEWLQEFTTAWMKEKKLRRKLMKLALNHPSWCIDLYKEGKPMYIQVRATTQSVDDEEHAVSLSKVHNLMYPLDYCVYVDELDKALAKHDSRMPPLQVEWSSIPAKKSELYVYQDQEPDE